MTLPTDPRPAFDDQDLPARVPGQELDQGSSFGRHEAQDPLNERVDDARPVDVASNDDDDFNPDDFVYVNVGGKVRAIPKASVEDEPETATQNIPKAAMVEVVDPHFYAWLANGEVIRVKQSDLPAAAGASAPFGHWQVDNKVFQIVNVYPVEDIVKGDNA